MSDDVKQEEIKKGPHRWKKGESGNPKGRPKVGMSVAEQLRKMLASQSKYNPDYTRQQVIMDTSIRLAEGGDDRSREFVMSRAYGKVPDKLITHEDKDGLIVDINGEDEDDKERDDEEE